MTKTRMGAANHSTFGSSDYCLLCVIVKVDYQTDGRKV